MKRKKNLLILLLVLVLLVGAVFAATSLASSEGEDEQTLQDLGTTIFTLDPDAVSQLSWDYSESVSFVAGDDGWEYTEDPAFALDETYISAMLDVLTEITASKVIENVDNWDQYGLEAPVCTVTVTTDNTYTLSFGEESALSGQRYFSIGDGNAYLIDSSVMSPFTYGLYDVLTLEQIPTMDGVTGIELENETEKLDITRLENSGLAYSDSYIWFLDDNVVLDTELTESLVSTLTSLSWNKCSNFNAADLSAYGLDDPIATVTIHYTQRTEVEANDTGENGDPIVEAESAPASFALEIGNESDDARYARIAGSHMVYLIDGSICDALLNASYENLMPDDILVMDWEKLQVLEITLDGTVHEIVRDTQTVTDDEGNETEEAIYTLDGLEADAAGILGSLDAMTSAGYATGIEPERSEEIRFLFRQDNEAFPEIELVFYQYDSTQCLVTLNGGSTVFVARSQVVDLVESITQLILS